MYFYGSVVLLQVAYLPMQIFNFLDLHSESKHVLDETTYIWLI